MMEARRLSKRQYKYNLVHELAPSSSSSSSGDDERDKITGPRIFTHIYEKKRRSREPWFYCPDVSKSNKISSSEVNIVPRLTVFIGGNISANTGLLRFLNLRRGGAKLGVEILSHLAA